MLGSVLAVFDDHALDWGKECKVVETIHWVHRLRDAAINKRRYVALAMFALLLMWALPKEVRISQVVVVFCFVPLVSISIWHFASACGNYPWSLDMKDNEDARKLVRDNVTAVIVFIVVGGIAIEVAGNDVSAVFGKMGGALASLIFLYPWLGLIRAVLAMHWTRKSLEKNVDPVAGAGEVGTRAPTSCDSVLADGLEGRGGVGSSRSGEERMSAVAQSADENSQRWQVLVAGVTIGVLFGGLVAVRNLRRN